MTDRIHIQPIRKEHHHKVGSTMGTTFKGHKLNEKKIKTEEIYED